MSQDSRPGPGRGARRRAARASIQYEDLGQVSRRLGQTARRSNRLPAILPAIIAAALVVGVVLSAGVTILLHTGSARNAASANLPPRYAVVFLIDGLSATELNSSALPHIRALVSGGTTYRNAWIGQAEAIQPASAASIGTSAYPRTHKVLGSVWRDSASGQVVRPASFAAVQQGSLDQIMESSQVDSLAGALKSSDPGARILSVGGNGCAEADALGTWVADFTLCPGRWRRHWVAAAVTGHNPGHLATLGPGWVRVARPVSVVTTVEGWRPGQETAWIARYAVRVIHVNKPRLMFVSLPELGQSGDYLPDASRARLTQLLLTAADRAIGSIENELKREHRLERTVIALSAGTQVTPADRAVDAMSLTNAVISAGGEETYFDGDAAAYIGVRDPLQAQPVAQAIQSLNLRNIDAIYYKARHGHAWRYDPQYLNPLLPATYASAMEYLLWTMTTPSSPDVVVIYAPATITAGQAIGKYRRTGGSSGFQWEDQHVPLVLYGRGVEVGRVSSFPARLVDIAPTIASLLRLPAMQSDGIVLADSLASPPSGNVSRQVRTRRWLSPYVDALQVRESQGS